MVHFPSLFNDFDRSLGTLGHLRLLRNWDEAPSQETTRINFVPATDIKETSDHFVLSFDVPGIDKKDIEIELRNRQLTIRGERKENMETKDGTSHYVERRYGAFERSITLPEGLQGDAAEAHHENGVLTLVIPKAAAAKTMKIKIGEDKPSLLKTLIGANKEGAHVEES